MIEQVATTGGRALRRPRRGVCSGLAVTSLLLVATACGGAEPEAVAESASSTTAVPSPSRAPSTTGSPTTSPPRISPPTTTAPTTSSTTLPPIASTTVFATSTTVGQATEPIPPPVDASASEPVIEMGTISIPKLDVAMTMYEGIRLPTLDRGPGHWPGSALPGAPGNVVVAGHRVSKHAVFRHLDQLDVGDELVFEDARGRHVYRVSGVEIVEPSAVWIVEPTETPTATLFACHPPGSTRERIVVFADLVTV